MLYYNYCIAAGTTKTAHTITSPITTSRALRTITTFVSTSPKTTTTAFPTFASTAAVSTIVPTGITIAPTATCHCYHQVKIMSTGSLESKQV